VKAQTEPVVKDLREDKDVVIEQLRAELRSKIAKERWEKRKHNQREENYAKAKKNEDDYTRSEKSRYEPKEGRKSDWRLGLFDEYFDDESDDEW